MNLTTKTSNGVSHTAVSSRFSSPITANSALFTSSYPLFPASGLATGSLNGLNPKSKFLGAILRFFCGVLFVAHASISSVAAQTAPVVATDNATQIKDLSATLNGTMNANFVGVWSWSFQIGKTEAFEQGQVTHSENFTVDGASTGSNPVALNVNTSILLPNTTYFYRLRVRQVGNGDNIIFGATRTFTTAPPSTSPTISSPTTGSPLEIGHNVVVMRATIKSGSSPSKVFIHYGPGKALGLRAELADPVAINSEAIAKIRLTNLTPGSTYHYRWVATNAEGTIAAEDRTFVTATAPLVETLAATEVTYFSAVLQGRANPNGGFTMSPGFELGTTTAYGSEHRTDNVVFLSGNTTSDLRVRVSNLLPNTTYHYRLFCDQNNTENTTYGQNFSFTTGSAGSLPSVESEPYARDITGYSTRVRIDRVSAGDSQTSAIVEYGTSAQFGLEKPIPDAFTPLSSDNIASETLENLLPATTYHYRFRLTNASGVVYSIPKMFTTPAPPVVATLPASNILDVSALLRGTVVANGNTIEIRIDWGTSTEYGNRMHVVYDSASQLQEWPLAFPPETTIHYRLNVTDGKNVYLGENQSFTTLPLIPKPPRIHGIEMDIATFTAFYPRPFITWDTARVVVNIDEGSSPATLVVEYGTTPQYGMVATSEGSLVSIKPRGISMLVKNLSPSTTYYCRGKLSSDQGTVYSPQITFTTMAEPVFLSLPAVDVTDHGAVLRTSIDPKAWFFYTEIEYGLTPACGIKAQQINFASVDGRPRGQVLGEVVNLSAFTELLQPSTTYYYRLNGETPFADGSRVYRSAVGSFTTLPPSSPPSINGSMSISRITSDSVTVNLPGVQSGSSAASVVFDYGLTDAYGSQNSYPGTIPAFGAENPSISLNGLTPGTLYHVRATVQNAQGQVQTQNLTFTTSPPGVKPSFSGAMTANNLNTTQATLFSGAVNSGSSNATIVFEYGLTNTYGSSIEVTNPITAGNTGNPQVTLQNLTPNTVYYARCTATNVHGSTSTSGIVFTTLQLPDIVTLPPSAITDLSAVLHASTNANGLSYNPTFEWGPTPSYGRTIAPVPSFISGNTTTTLSSSLSGLLPSTTYHFRLKIGNIVGNNMSFTTTAASTLPVINGSIIPYDIKPTSASLKVATSIHAGGSDATVIFEYGLTTSYEFATAVPGSIPVGTSSTSGFVSLTGLTPDTLYYGRFRVSNAQGTIYSPTIEFSTSFHVLPKPATDVTDITARLNGSVNAGGGTLSNIRFLWGATASSSTVAAVTPTTVSGTETSLLSATLPGLLPNTLYYYRLTGSDGTNTLHTGPQMTFQTTGAASPPSAPEPVVATVIGLNTATVRADNVRSGGSSATVRFEYGTTLAYGSEVVHGSSIPTNTTTSPQVNLSGLTAATTYNIRCRIQNAHGTTFSPNATFTTAAVPVLTANNATTVTDTSATLNGHALYPGLTLTSVRFTFGIGGIYNSSQFSTTSIPGTESGSFILSSNLINLTPNTTYNYRVEANSPWGQSYVSTARTFTTGPANTPPTISGGLAVTSVSNTKVRLSPSLIRAGSSNTTVSYEYGLTTSYGTTKAGPSISTNQSSAETVDLINLQPSTTYHVRCRATNGQGFAVSNSVTFTTFATPAVTSLAPTSVTDLTAIFNGTVNPVGNTVNVGYDWGESSTLLLPLSLFGSDISRFQNVTGTSALALPSPLLNNLKPSTTYFYRIRASDALNTWNGTLLNFTTPAASTPPRLDGTLTVSSVTMRTAAATFKNSNPFQPEAIFAGGRDATISLEYGTTTAYGSTITVLTGGSSVPAGASQNFVLGRMSNLQSGTFYNARLKVSSTLGTVYSENVTFTTLTDPIVITGGASANGEFTATLSADVTAGPGTEPVLVHFDWGLTENYGSSSNGTFGYSGISVPADTTRQVTMPISGLSPGQTYHYRAKAYGYADPSNGATVWYFGQNRTFSTPVAATPPTLTTVPILSNVKSTVATVRQTYYTGSTPTTVTLEYGTSNSYGSQAAHTTNPTPNTTTSGNATLTGLLPSTTYYLRAKAVNTQGTVYSPGTTFTTATPPALELGLPNGITSTSATLNGILGSGDIAIFTYRFEWGTTTAYGSGVNATRNGNSLSASISGLIPSATYHYRLVATDGANTTFTNSASFVSGPPPVPPIFGTMTSAYSITPTAATLWINSVTAPATVIFEYGLTSAYGSVAIFPRTTSPDGILRNVAVELANLLPGSNYNYRCRATNTQGTTVGENMVFRTLDLPALLTQAPGELADKSFVLQGEINAREGLLAPSFDLGTTPAYGQVVVVQDGTVTGADPEPISASLSGLIPETTYHFRLKASDPRGRIYYGEPMTTKTLSVSGAWRYKYFKTADNAGIAADHANPAGDGIPNLMKYALDMDPLKSSVLPMMSRIRAEGNMGYSFVRDSDKREITYVVEATSDLSGIWQPLATSIDGQPTTGLGFIKETDAGGNKKTVEVQDILDISQAPRRFMRLKVMRNEN